jgi:hypothetical protein
MMNRRLIFGILLALALIAGAVSVGAFAFNVGLTQGMAQGVAQGAARSAAMSDGPAAAAPMAQPYPYYGIPYWGWGYRPFGFGFFGCFGPLLFFFLIFALFRGMMWGGHWGPGPGWRHHGPHPWGDRPIPPMFEEWHRQAHQQEAEPASPKPEEQPEPGR